MVSGPKATYLEPRVPDDRRHTLIFAAYRGPGHTRVSGGARSRGGERHLVDFFDGPVNPGFPHGLSSLSNHTRQCCTAFILSHLARRAWGRAGDTMRYQLQLGPHCVSQTLTDSVDSAAGLENLPSAPFLALRRSFRSVFFYFLEKLVC